jgi:hypothetical protein
MSVVEPFGRALPRKSAGSWDRLMPALMAGVDGRRTGLQAVVPVSRVNEQLARSGGLIEMIEFGRIGSG